MATRSQKAQVGLFLLLSVAALVMGLVLASGASRGNKAMYWMEFDKTVLGLNIGAQVFYLGVNVGSVHELYVTQQGLAHVDILIDRKKLRAAGLHEGVVAQLSMSSVATGMMCISLEGGDPDGALLENGSQLPISPSLVESFLKQVQDLLDQVNKAVAQLNTGLKGMRDGELTDLLRNGSEFLKDGRSLVASTQKTVERVADQVEPSLEEYRKLAQDLRTVVQTANKTVETVREKVAALKVEQTQQEVSVVLQRINEFVLKLEKTAEALETATHTTLHQTDNVEYNLRETLRTVNETLESVRELSTYLQQDPSSLVRGKGTPKRKP